MLALEPYFFHLSKKVSKPSVICFLTSTMSLEVAGDRIHFIRLSIFLHFANIVL